MSAVVLLVGSIPFWSDDFILFPKHSTTRVLVLDNCDTDFRTPPFEDAVVAFGPDQRFSRLVTNLNLCLTVGGGRCLGVSPDGRFFVVCENVGNRLTAYDTRTGRPLWNVDGEFTAATVAEDGKVYAILSSGTIYGARTVVIDHTGRTLKSSDTAGFDMALDARRQVLWEVGKTIKKCDLELNVLREIHPIKWCAVSVDINPDGSIWVAERDHPDVAQSSNRLHKISSDGQVLKTIGLRLDPACLRIDPSDGSIWVTGYQFSKPVTGRILDAIERRTGPLPLGKKLPDYLRRTRYWPMTCKFDQEGNPLLKLSKGGHSLEIQSSDGSVWLAGKDRIHHYSREGRKLARFGGVSSDQKYIVIIPEREAGAGSSSN